MIDVVPDQLSTAGFGIYGPESPEKVDQWFANKQAIYGITALLDVRDMIDGKNPLHVYTERIVAAVELLQQGHYLLIACVLGRSRCNAIAAGAFATLYDVGIDNAIGLLQQKGAKIHRAHIAALQQLFA